MRKNKIYEDKEKLISDFKSSNLSMTEWCRQHNIPCSTLAGWLRTATKKSKISKSVKFVEVTTANGNTVTEPTLITVEYKDLKISVSERMAPELFKSMLKAVMEIYV